MWNPECHRDDSSKPHDLNMVELSANSGGVLGNGNCLQVRGVKKVGKGTFRFSLL